jgi:hypothetical protein
MIRKETSCDILEIIKMKKLMTKNEPLHKQNDTHCKLICIKSYSHFFGMN